MQHLSPIPYELQRKRDSFFKRNITKYISKHPGKFVVLESKNSKIKPLGYYNSQEEALQETQDNSNRSVHGIPTRVMRKSCARPRHIEKGHIRESYEISTLLD